MFSVYEQVIQLFCCFWVLRHTHSPTTVEILFLHSSSSLLSILYITHRFSDPPPFVHIVLCCHIQAAQWSWINRLQYHPGPICQSPLIGQMLTGRYPLQQDSMGSLAHGCSFTHIDICTHKPLIPAYRTKWKIYSGCIRAGRWYQYSVWTFKGFCFGKYRFPLSAQHHTIDTHQSFFLLLFPTMLKFNLVCF